MPALGQLLVGAVAFSHNNQPGSVLVQAVHNARPQNAVNAGKVAAMRQQSVHQRSLPVAGRRMHHHSPRLVHHQQVGVLKHHIQRNILRLRLQRLSLRQLGPKLVARPKRVIRFGQIRLATGRLHLHAALLQQLLPKGARLSLRRISRQKQVNSLAGFRLRYHKM